MEKTVSELFDELEEIGEEAAGVAASIEALMMCLKLGEPISGVRVRNLSRHIREWNQSVRS